MVKLRKSKLKKLNKLNKQQKSGNVSNKIIKKRINAENKLTFQKQVLLQDAVINKSPLVRNVATPKQAKKPPSTAPSPSTASRAPKPATKKQRPVQKQKQRHITLVNDAKLLLKFMKS